MSSERISKLYPNEAQADPQQPVRAQDQVPSEMYPDAEPGPAVNPYDFDSESLESRMYGGTDKIQLARDTDLHLLAGEGDQKAVHDDLGYMASAIGASQSDMHSLVNIVNEYALAPPTGVTSEESRQTLYQEYGSEMDSKLNDARLLVNSLPGLANWLNESGAGNDVRMIKQFIKFTETPRAQQRLKTLKRGK